MARKKITTSQASTIVETQVNHPLVPIGPVLDDATGGGLEEGIVCLIRTLTGVGKTTLCMSIVANALKQGRKVLYVDAERRLTDKKYFDIHGLDVNNPNFEILRSERGMILTGNVAYAYILEHAQKNENYGTVYVIDSMSRLIAEETMQDSEVTAQRRDQSPRLNADFCKKAFNIARVNGSIVIIIQHMMVDTSPYGGGAFKPIGGGAVEFDGDVILTSKKKPMSWDGKLLGSSGDDILGQQVQWIVEKNKRKAPYINKNNPLCAFIRYGEGVYFAREMFECLQKWINPESDSGCSYIYKSAPNSPWFNIWDGKQYTKVSGQVATIDFIDENREYYEEVYRNYMKNTYNANYEFKPPIDD